MLASSIRSVGRFLGASCSRPMSVMKAVSTVDLIELKKRKKPITMVTAYSYPSAVHVDLAGIDVILVGDSVAMVELGYDTTLHVTVDDMLHHCKAVARGAKRSLLVGDMPFGSYEASEKEALATARRFLKEGNMNAVKMEGGMHMARTARKLVESGVAVMGHIGLTPQAISVLGGFRVQGKTAANAVALIDDALALQDAGCFAVVIECVPPVVAQAVTDALEIPTIGIGAGPHTSGQVLVYHDLLGMMSHPHHNEFTPRFCKKYANVGGAIRLGLDDFRREVEEGVFPSKLHSPYKMPKVAEEEFLELVARRNGGGRVTGAAFVKGQNEQPVASSSSGTTAASEEEEEEDHNNGVIKVY